jgi:hypothetical protein
MPNFNGTGPRGKGPMTGGGMGYCVIPLSNPERKLDFLISQTQVLEAQLQQVRARLSLLKMVDTKSITTEVHHARI